MLQKDLRKLDLCNIVANCVTHLLDLLLGSPGSISINQSKIQESHLQQHLKHPNFCRTLQTFKDMKDRSKKSMLSATNVQKLQDSLKLNQNPMQRVYRQILSHRVNSMTSIFSVLRACSLRLSELASLRIWSTMKMRLMIQSRKG